MHLYLLTVYVILILVSCLVLLYKHSVTIAIVACGLCYLYNGVNMASGVLSVLVVSSEYIASGVLSVLFVLSEYSQWRVVCVSCME